MSKMGDTVSEVVGGCRVRDRLVDLRNNGLGLVCDRPLTARYFVDAQHREAFGLLSAIAGIWMYERPNPDLRWDRLRYMISATSSRARD